MFEVDEGSPGHKESSLHTHLHHSAHYDGHTFHQFPHLWMPLLELSQHIFALQPRQTDIGDTVYQVHSSSCYVLCYEIGDR